MSIIKKKIVTSSFKKVVRKMLKDSNYYAAVKTNPKAAIGYYYNHMTAEEKQFLKDFGKRDVQKEFNTLKALIETARPPRIPAWI